MNFTPINQIYLNRPENKDPWEGFHSTCSYWNEYIKRRCCLYCDRKFRLLTTEKDGPTAFYLSWGIGDEEERVEMCDCNGSRRVGLTKDELESIHADYYYRTMYRPKDWRFKTGYKHWQKECEKCNH